MSNLDNIVKKLQEETKLEIDKINNETLSEVKSIEDKIIGEANLERNKILEEANKRANNTYDRILENSKLRIRDEKISSRQKVVNRIFENALSKLENLSDSEFYNFVDSQVKKLNLDDDYKIIIPKDKLNAFKGTDIERYISSDEFTNSGFFVSSGRVNYNFNFEDLLNSKREEIEPDILRKL